MPKLGELGGSVQVLRDMRDKLVESERMERIEDERWERLGAAVDSIAKACEDRDLEALASANRGLKNKLRAPGVRKALARLEAKGEEEPKGKDKIPAPKEKNPTGECKCDQCGKIIDGSKEPCVEGALCTRCALKNKVISKDKQDKQTKKKPVVPRSGGGGQRGGGQQGGDQGQDVPDERREERGFLRRRGYLG